MKQYLVLMGVLLLMLHLCYGQNSALYGINAAYGSQNLSGNRYSYTIGQLSSSTLSQSNVKIEIGFIHCLDPAKCPTSIAPLLAANNIKLYPNPTTDRIQLESTLNSSLKYQIIGSDGRMYLSGQFVTQESLDISLFSNGLYIVLMYDDEGTLVYRAKIAKQ